MPRDLAAHDPPAGPFCIIGAGSSGLAAVKALADRGLPFDCFEASDRIGGNWAAEGAGGRSAAYRSLHTNSSRTRTEFADLPMPADFPDFPHRDDMARYFEAYAARFRLHERITFRIAVTRAEREPDGWAVTLSSGETRRYGALIVANGHHWDPRLPEIPGRFDGDTIHAHAYRDPDEPLALRGRRVVVVGLGNSAVDIAAELARPGAAARVFLSVRRGAWIMPKHLFGRPLDTLSVAHAGVPWRVQSLIARLLLALVAPAPWRLGLPRPDHPPLAAHPTISDDLIPALRAGAITPKPALAALDGACVRFADGSAEEVDAIVFCTGYKVSFPFFDREFLAAPGNDLPLWLRILRPGDTDLFFVGLLQPLGAIMPLAEAQSKLIADYLAGAWRPPDPATMRAELARDREALAHRYVRSPRHTMQVDFDRYLRDLRRAHAAGRRRAEAATAGAA